MLVLASSSPSRIKLLQSIGIEIDLIFPTNIDESVLKREKAMDLSKRLSKEKMLAAISKAEDSWRYVITADTVSSAGYIILPKAETDDLVRYCLTKVSGRRSRTYTTVSVCRMIDKKIISKTVETKIAMKRLTEKEIQKCIESKEGINKAGGFALEGFMQQYVSWVQGSWSNVIGIPLYETKCLLEGLGYFW